MLYLRVVGAGVHLVEGAVPVVVAVTEVPHTVPVPVLLYQPHSLGLLLCYSRGRGGGGIGIGMNRNDKQLELNAEGFNENCGHKILGYSLFL